MELCQASVSCSSFLFLKNFTDVLPSPHNPKELFNLHHSSACNVIERIFGILKRQFQILWLPPEYNMSIQARIPPALAALHNFIQLYDPEEIQMYDDNDDDNHNDADELLGFRPDFVGELELGLVTPHEVAQANKRRDKIVDEMWEQYQCYLTDRAAHNE
jgi:hypothetical protein